MSFIIVVSLSLQNAVANPSGLASPIQDFYTDTNILVTGATGFIGKALVEKLLRSCTNINRIYMLIRSKKGHSVETRYEKLISNSVSSLNWVVLSQKLPR